MAPFSLLLLYIAMRAKAIEMEREEVIARQLASGPAVQLQLNTTPNIIIIPSLMLQKGSRPRLDPTTIQNNNLIFNIKAYPIIPTHDLSPLNLRANLMSFFWMVTLLAWMAAKLVSSNKETK